MNDRQLMGRVVLRSHRTWRVPGWRPGIVALVATLSLATATPVGLVAAEPERYPVWNSPAEDGVLYYHIPQILVTNSGTVLACAEARHSHGDGVKVDIVLRRSGDSGRTWSKSSYLERATGRENYVLPVMLQERRTGRIFFHCALRDAGIEDRTTENFYRYSDDDGVSWSDRIDVTKVLLSAEQRLQAAIRENRTSPAFRGEAADLYGRRLFFFGPGRPIQLSSTHPSRPGRLAIPMLVIKDRNLPERNRRGYGNALLASDDRGETWHVAGITPIGDVAASEPSLVELSDGRLVLNTRETPGRDFLAAPAGRTISLSTDGGTTWTRPVLDTSGIPPYHETHAGMLRVTDAGRDGRGSSRLLFSFPAGPKRMNGTVMLSDDDHHSWRVQKLLVAGEFGYSNMDRLPDGTVLLIYENGSGTSSATPSAITVVRFSLDWLSATTPAQ